ncbi:MerR [Saccharomonospora sp.]|uniref:MerR n=1 Tax=Saccharomonospora sp. TaxID=33913 RepID=UPI00260442BF|nr:MerR [Saccharomonospora sp.]
MTTTYTVTVTRDEDVWLAEATTRDGRPVTALDFDDFDDLHTTMPEAIADMIDTDPADITIDWRYEIMGHDITEPLKAAKAASAELKRVQSKRDQALSFAITSMRDAGLSQAVIGDVVGLSKQRVSQILANHAHRRRVRDDPHQPVAG